MSLLLLIGLLLQSAAAPELPPVQCASGMATAHFAMSAVLRNYPHRVDPEAELYIAGKHSQCGLLSEFTPKEKRRFMVLFGGKWWRAAMVDCQASQHARDEKSRFFLDIDGVVWKAHFMETMGQPNMRPIPVMICDIHW